MSQNHRTSDLRSLINLAELRNLRLVEAYLSWNLHGTSNLISRLEARIADIEQKLLKTDLEAQERKKTRRSRYKAFNNLKHCKAEAQMLHDALNEICLKISAQDQMFDHFTTPSTLYAAQFSLYSNTPSAIFSPDYYLQCLQSPMKFGFSRTIPYSCTSILYLHGQHSLFSSLVQTPSFILQTLLAHNHFLMYSYIASTCPFRPQLLYSPMSMPYGFSPMLVPIATPFHPQNTPLVAVTGSHDWLF
jgi:hypothetical protein